MERNYVTVTVCVLKLLCRYCSWCFLPENPLHIRCEAGSSLDSASRSTNAQVDSDRWRHLANRVENPSRLVHRHDLVVKPVERGLYFSPSARFKVKKVKGKGSPYSITERRVPKLIPVLGSQPAGDVSYKPDGRVPLLSARRVVTHTTLTRAATNFAAW